MLTGRASFRNHKRAFSDLFHGWQSADEVEQDDAILNRVEQVADKEPGNTDLSAVRSVIRPPVAEHQPAQPLVEGKVEEKVPVQRPAAQSATKPNGKGKKVVPAAKHEPPAPRNPKMSGSYWGSWPSVICDLTNRAEVADANADMDSMILQMVEKKLLPATVKDHLDLDDDMADAVISYVQKSKKPAPKGSGLFEEEAK